MKYSKIFKAILAGFIITSALQPAFANPNSVYIDQQGVLNHVMITQLGGNNGVGGFASTTPSDTNYATIIGNTNSIAFAQVGVNNLTQYAVMGNTNSYTSNITGNDNTIKLHIGSALAPKNQNTIYEAVIGLTNLIDQTISANQVVSTVLITGNNNDVVTSLASDRGNSYVEIQGLATWNRVEVEQTDVAGANGHNAKVLITDGTRNSVLVQQQGTNDNTTDIRISGSSNTITVRSSSTTFVNARVAPPR
jgi:hypothetical protein